VTGFLWIVLIGLIAGVIARFVLPGPNNPQGFVLTTVLGSRARSLPRGSARQSAGTGRIRALGSSVPHSAR
jgi:hypothetical protein